MSTVIKVENLGKTYLIRHQADSRSKYVALRDVMAETGKNILRTIINPFRKSSHINNGTAEEFWALKNISFEVHDGDRIGIIGRNGAGKSTLLKLISRITEPATGRISIKGRVASLLEVGTGFHPELTGRENIYLNGSILGMSRMEINKKFDEIVDFAEIEKFLDTPVKRYSSGMYVRLAFAVAAHLEPEILLIDEVLAVGDAQFQKKCLGKMDDISKKEGRTILFVSHNMSAIKNFCNTGLYLFSGNIEYSGSIEDVIHEYLNISTLEEKPFIELKEKSGLSAQFSTVSIVNEENDFALHHPYDQPFYIKIKLIVRKKNLRIYISIHLHNSEGETLIFARDFEFNPSIILERKEGLYNYSIKIPSPLLVPGWYTISAHIADYDAKRNIDEVNQVCSFEIVDNGSTCSMMGFPWVGKVYTPLEWEFTREELH